jgi:hypothetical protein
MGEGSFIKLQLKGVIILSKLLFERKTIFLPKAEKNTHFTMPSFPFDHQIEFSLITNLFY